MSVMTLSLGLRTRFAFNCVYHLRLIQNNDNFVTDNIIHCIFEISRPVFIPNTTKNNASSSGNLMMVISNNYYYYMGDE